MRSVLLCVAVALATAQHLALFSLPYAYDALEPHMDEATMRVHHLGHTATYLTRCNDVLGLMRSNPQTHSLAKRGLGLLTSLELVPEEHRAAVRNNCGGFVNHELFFSLMAPRPVLPEGAVEDASTLGNVFVDATAALHVHVAARFGSWSAFKAAFKQQALSLFGSGWVWLVYDRALPDGEPGSRLRIATSINQDSPVNAHVAAVLALDVWEHAYYLKHQNKRGDYVDAWFNVLDFRAANARFEAELAHTHTHAHTHEEL